DSREQLDERAERLQPSHLPLQLRPFLQLRPRRIPRILLERTQRQRDALMPFVASSAPACGLRPSRSRAAPATNAPAFGLRPSRGRAALLRLHAQDLDANLLAGLHDVLRVRDALMRELGYVHEPLEAAQIDEGPEIAHGRDGAVQHRADLELLAHLGRLRGALLLQKCATREDRVAAADLHHAELQLLADELRRVLDEADVDLRRRTERAQAAQVDFEATLV